ncbi:MAG: hypothetical protein A3F70_17975 [Acidobacteria bacterium RIFCSPLOWO2_12_FULL_67_14]|nr:MAG: hypothetical protein A3H29_08955 [Acidobacteria bacterium RIFCSPLOWO2_02_FULL_67_21]OFW36103.1 MAG: hypothetical protein A3F70_17975 [Acidobacteria bacterium RIFCSPLOWO2_12_FULL_67_14]
MKLAWFRHAIPVAAHPLDDTAGVIGELGRDHAVDVFTRATAHDFVWRQFRHPYDLCVFELDNTPDHAFVWPYLLHYSGLLLLRAFSLHDSRARSLIRAQRRTDYVEEFAFSEGRSTWFMDGREGEPRGSWPMLRIPLAAARMTAVLSRSAADTLQEIHPEARLRPVPPAIPGPAPAPDGSSPDFSDRRPLVFGALASPASDMVQNAAARARDAGTPIALVLADSAERLVAEADVILALRWPSHTICEALPLAAMASGRPFVVFETRSTADWPLLDPQTWRPRDFTPEAPVGISIDVRDAEHSLMLALRRLAADPALRASVGAAGQAWWGRHATVAHATAAWRALLGEAASLDVPLPPAGWPAHLRADGTERARSILRDFGAGVDLFR